MQGGEDGVGEVSGEVGVVGVADVFVGFVIVGEVGAAGVAEDDLKSKESALCAL